jgi:hypothetical protein
MPSERREEQSPMSRTPSLHRRLLVALAGAMLLLGAMSAAARAEGYGELGHFGKGAGIAAGSSRSRSREWRNVFLGRILAGIKASKGEWARGIRAPRQKVWC